MKKKSIIISAIILIVITSILVIYKKNEAEEHEIRETEKKHEIIKIAYVVCGSPKDLNNLEFDIREVIIVIALYNETVDRGVQKGEKISDYMEVQEEFDDYMSGRKTLEECRAINALCDFDKAVHCYDEKKGISYSYSYYYTLINNELAKNTGRANYKDNSYGEIEAASKIAAKKWCDYMEGK